MACSQNFTESDLIGKYIISTDDGVDTIELKSNGTYIHSYSIKGGPVQQQQGSWDIETFQAGPTVVLTNFQSIFPEDNIEKQNSKITSYYLFLVRKNFDDIYLITNIDLNIGYEKQS